jgi:hypothetical protein
MTTSRRHRRVSRVQFSGRSYGAPYELDAAERLWNLLEHRTISPPQLRTQTRKYNLISVISGPTIGVHFITAIRNFAYGRRTMDLILGPKSSRSHDEEADNFCGSACG